ncbi:MAG: helix-turn-helix transcriptional regulator [Planctomycetes bacterium]|nr:helix-turn-helix transcriptional regulator [Planctomycetota bacterium]
MVQQNEISEIESVSENVSERSEQLKSFPIHFEEIHVEPEFPIIGQQYDVDNADIEDVHAHNVLEIGFCIQGSGVLLVEGRLQAFHSGCCSIIRRNDCHRMRSTENTSSTWCFFFIKPELLLAGPHYDTSLLKSDTLGGNDFPNILYPEQYPTPCTLIKEMYRCLDTQTADYKSMMGCLVGALMPALHQLPGQTEAKKTAKDQSFPRIAPALKHIGNNLNEEVRIENLASICKVSLAHFRRLFQDAMCESPKQYLNRFRIHHAAAMLQSSRRSVIDIALACGFQSPSSFNRQFRNIMDCSPREWRNKPQTHSTSSGFNLQSH